MPKPRKRNTLQSGYRLDLNYLLRNGLKSGRSIVRFGSEGAIGTLTTYFYESLEGWLHLQVPPSLDQTIGLVCSARPFGGVQWYMRCPLSGAIAPRFSTGPEGRLCLPARGTGAGATATSRNS